MQGFEKGYNENDLLTDVKFGLCRGHWSVDAIFVLKILLSDIKRLYWVFIDIKKAFDSVYRNVLWLGLFKIGLECKLLVMFNSMYIIVNHVLIIIIVFLRPSN